MNQLNQEFVTDLYNPEKSGLNILKNHISLGKLTTINQFIADNSHNFQEKREKYIENNQLVALLYRGSFDTEALDDTIFKDIINTYKHLRKIINQYSAIPFEQGTSLEIKLIQYPLSELGVGNHKDLSSNINVVIFFNLEGSADIKIYSDKAGNNPVSHFIAAGDISVMRAPRLNETVDLRPYHGVEKVTERRTVLVVREINEELEKLTNKDNWRGF
jgi:hypothetical protein